MLFNSPVFIFAFLPVTFFIYFYLNQKRLTEASKAFLVLASLFFYSWWNIVYLPIILLSILFNYVIGVSLSKADEHVWVKKKTLLTIGIMMNVLLLGYFKYADFFIENINMMAQTNISLLQLVLPLAISFFTFQQIAYLVDSYRGETKEYDFLNYANFVTFFPQLIAGPIVHHSEMMTQFAANKNKVKNYRNIAVGLFIFSIGLFKKVVIADTFSVWASAGFDSASVLSFFEAWATSLSYTFQLYFDFSGYTDMAIGAALLFNIKLPINFNSPYKALSIQDFWRRWHITLSRFLRDYIYIPLGGNKKGYLKTYTNLMATFIIGGIWHGAGWTFVFWGFLHGIALITQRVWQQFGFRLHRVLAWFITFNFINITWVFFRAKSWEDAQKVLSGMFGRTEGENFSISFNFLDTLSRWVNHPLYDVFPVPYKRMNVDEIALIYSFLALIIVLVMKNSMYYLTRDVDLKLMMFGSVIFSYAVVQSFLTTTEVFLYFNF